LVPLEQHSSTAGSENRERRCRPALGDSEGAATAFDKLIIATGSHAFVPQIPGVDKKNVYVFRTLDDAHGMLERSREGLKAVVIGGGVLGLEAARGLQMQGCDVTVVHLVNTLMERHSSISHPDIFAVGECTEHREKEKAK
jgi:NAD(P)H-nitrite reductase large subunit